MKDSDISKLTIAPIGAAYMILSASDSGKMGIVKEFWSARKAAAHKSDGPAKDLIEAAIKQSKNKEVSDKIQKTVGAKWSREQLGEVGSEWLRESMAVIQNLPDDQADHIKSWILDTGRKTAEAAKDKKSDERVSQAEKDTLAEISEILNQ